MVSLFSLMSRSTQRIRVLFRSAGSALGKVKMDRKRLLPAGRRVKVPPVVGNKAITKNNNMEPQVAVEVLEVNSVAEVSLLLAS